jgi:thioredoxin reductase
LETKILLLTDVFLNWRDYHSPMFFQREGMSGLTEHLLTFTQKADREKGDPMFDVIIVGGGPAGLSAALNLGRSCRQVLLCDAGKPRNASAPAAHGLLSRDGIAPTQLLHIGREQLLPYSNIELREREVLDAQPLENGFKVTLADGVQEEARVLLLATGVKDELPAIPGFTEFWGRGVFHCPYCQGWEVRNQPLAIYGKGEQGLGTALNLTNWSRDLVLCSDGPAELSQQDLALLAELQIPVRQEPIARLEGRQGEQMVLQEGQHSLLDRIIFTNGESLPRHALFLATKQHRGALFTRLGATRVDADGETEIPHLYLAGDISNSHQKVALAIAGGVRAALAINKRLIEEDLQTLTSTVVFV